VKNPQTSDLGETSGPAAWAAEGVEAKRAKNGRPSVPPAAPRGHGIARIRIAAGVAQLRAIGGVARSPKS
jgi:hypothetical protein